MEATIDGIIEYIKRTITGQESGLYKRFGGIIVDPMFVNVRLSALADYMNVTYVSLILDDDEYVTNSFNKMDGLKHSKICLLNILFAIIKKFYETNDYSIMKNNSYDSYMLSLRMILYVKMNEVKEMLKETLNHKCTGIDIKTCNPNEPMFIITPKP